MDFFLYFMAGCGEWNELLTKVFHRKCEITSKQKISYRNPGSVVGVVVAISSSANPQSNLLIMDIHHILKVSLIMIQILDV